MVLQVQLLTNKKGELERRIGVLSEEKESFACSLEESQERIMKLERQRQEKDQAVSTLTFFEKGIFLQLNVMHLMSNLLF